MTFAPHKRNSLRPFIFAVLACGAGAALYHFEFSPWISRAADEKNLTLAVRALPPTPDGHIVVDVVLVNSASHYVSVYRGIDLGEFGIQVMDFINGAAPPLTANGKLRLYSSSNPQSGTGVPPGGTAIWRTDLSEMFVFQPGMMYTVRARMLVGDEDYTPLDLKSNVDWFQDPSTRDYKPLSDSRSE